VGHSFTGISRTQVIKKIEMVIEFCQIKIAPQTPCSVGQSATLCEMRDPHNPSLANIKEKLRIMKAWICTGATGQPMDNFMEQNFFISFYSNLLHIHV
jgi:hypothetical protein